MRRILFLSVVGIAPKDKQGIDRAEFVAGISGLLDEIQSNLLAKAKAFPEGAYAGDHERS